LTIKSISNTKFSATPNCARPVRFRCQFIVALALLRPAECTDFQRAQYL